MKKLAGLVLLAAALAVAGCAQKSESEKTMDAFKKDANKAMNQVQRDVNNL